MSGIRNRRIYFAEGFGYSTTDLRKIYRSGTAASTATVDTTTVAGRNFVRIPAGQYLDIVLPNFSANPYTETFNDANNTWVIQGKVYIDADSYTNVTANRAFFEILSADAGVSGVGFSPNTSTAQDNWWLRYADVTTDYAINVNAGGTPAIPMRTVRDIKLIVRVTGGNDGQIWAYVDDYLVAYTNSTLDQMDNMNANFKGIRLWGLQEQTGDTLWGELIAYRAGYVLNETLFLGNVIGSGTSLFNKEVRVLDLTPDTDINGINEFDTIGAMDSITALSSLDNSTYVASDDYGQEFLLKPKLPEGYIEGNDSAIGSSELAIYNHNTPVHAFNYMTWTKDLTLTGARIEGLVRDNTNGYRFRYYRIQLSGSMSTTGGTLNRISFYDSNFAPMTLPSGITMRLDRITGITEYDVPENAGSLNNTTIHTAMLTASVPRNIYDTVLTFTGLDIKIDGYVAEYLIDFGAGNIAPSWYAIGITQSGATDRIYTSAGVYGSDDGIDWYSVGDNYYNFVANGTSYVLNRRSTDYPSTQFRQRTIFDGFNVGGAQFDPLHLTVYGDPMNAAILPSSRNIDMRSPIPLGQFKDYLIGLRVVDPEYQLPSLTSEGVYVNFAYDNFVGTEDIFLSNSYLNGSNNLVMTDAGKERSNVNRIIPSSYNRDWSMSWRMTLGGGSNLSSFSINWATGAYDLTPDWGSDTEEFRSSGRISGARHSIGFLDYDFYSPLRWYQADGTLYTYQPAGFGDFVGTYYYWLDYDHSASILSIYVSTTATKPASPLQIFYDFYFADGTIYYAAFGSQAFDDGALVTLYNWSLMFPNAEGLVTYRLVLQLDAGDTESYPGTGTTWTDLTGYKNNGTLVNGLAYRNVNNGILTFNGANDYVTVPDDPSLRPASLTQSAWIKFTDVPGSGNYTIMAKNYGTTDESFSLWWSGQSSDGVGARAFHATVGSNSTTGYVFEPDPDLWYNVAHTFDNATKVSKLFINGALVDTKTLTGISIAYDDQPLTVGAEYDASTYLEIGSLFYFFPGSIAQIKLYDRTLTDAEILQNYNAYRERYNVISSGLLVSLDAANPASYSGTGSTWTDLSGNGNDFTIINPTYVSDFPAHFSFEDDIQNDRMVDATPTYLSGLNTLTTSIWVRFDNSDGQTAPISYAVPESANEYTWFVDTATGIYFYAGGETTTTLDFGTSLQPGVWYNITHVWGATTHKLYLNGILKSIVGRTNLSSSLRGSGYLMLGQEQDSVGGNLDITQSLYGDLGAVQFYNRELSDAEVARNYNAVSDRFNVVTQNLVLNLDATDSASYPGTGTVWNDLSTSRNATLINGPVYSSTPVKSIYFDGVNDYAQVSGTIVASEATFLAWIKRDGNQASYAGIIYSRGPGIINDPRVNGINFLGATNKLGYNWYDASSTYAWDSGLTVPDAEWCMCAVSVSSGSATAYLCRSSGITSATNITNHSSPISLDDIKIGQDDYNSSRYFKGNIGQAMIYDRALTGDEIRRNFSALRTKFGV